MDPQDFIIGEQGGDCIGALVEDDIPDDNKQEWVFILGALFMKNVVTVFDLGRPAVGFGHIKGVNGQFGEYAVISSALETQLGTGPLASLSPTYNPQFGPLL